MLGPADLVAEPPDVVVAMNRVYLEEIRHDLDTRGMERTTLLGV